MVDHQRAEELTEAWQRFGLARVPLELVECPDRRLTRAAVETVARELADGETEVSVLLPDRMYGTLWRRILHDQTAEAIARDVSRLPHANVTTVPFHLESRRRFHRRDGLTPIGALAGDGKSAAPAAPPTAVAAPAATPTPEPDGTGSTKIGSVRWRQHVRVAGRVESMRVLPIAGVQTLECTLTDGTGRLEIVFFRPKVAGIDCGVRLIAEGMAGEHRGRLAILNPTYELLG